MSNISKGDNAVLRAQRELEFRGYMVEKVKKVRWSPQDFFSLFDLIAIKPTHVRFIQVSNSPMYDRPVAYKRKLKEFPLIDNTSKEYWYLADGYWKVKFISDGQERELGDFARITKKRWTDEELGIDSQEQPELEPQVTPEDYSQELPF